MHDDYTVFSVIDDDYHMCFLMDTYPILACVWCTCLFFFMYGVFDVVKEGSRSHLLVGIYTMHHFLPLLV